MPFFVNAKTKKRKFEAKDQKIKGKKKDARNPKALSEEIESDSDLESTEASETRGKFFSSDEEEEETPQQKRLRLAKEYLSQLENEETEAAVEDEDTVKQAVSDRLQHDISEQAGKLVKEIADTCSCPRQEDLRVFRGHGLPVTAVVVSPDDKFVFTASKDCNICKWDVQSGLKVKTIKGGRKGTEDVHVGHTDHILCLAISSDSKFLAAGDMANMIKIWRPEDCSFVHKFRGHRGPVTGVSFRKGTHTLFSCSSDKSVKVWSVEELAYVETLYGHNCPVTCVDSLSRDRAVTSGGRDKSIHIWKIPEDSQLLFYGHEGSIECVALINEGNFFSGADDSSLCLWSVLKKKPLVTRQHAHGTSSSHNSEDWITSVAALQYTDLVASGSKDGFVRLWKCGPNFRSLTPLFQVPVNGFVNSLCFSSNGDFLVAGVGQEHRLGRWWRLKDAKNSWVIIPLKKKAPQVNGVAGGDSDSSAGESEADISDEAEEEAEDSAEEETGSDEDEGSKDGGQEKDLKEDSVSKEGEGVDEEDESSEEDQDSEGAK